MTAIRASLTVVKTRLNHRYKNFLGFPVARDINYTELYPFFNGHINNVGDPFASSLSDIHTKDLEQEVLAFFAKLWRAPSDYWGYVTTGGTEGNLYALYNARQLFPKATLYFSAAAHYSIPKCAALLQIKTVVVKTQHTGEIDYAALQAAIQPGVPAIVVANIGSTMTEAIDDVARIKQILQQHAPSQHYIHSDAALAGAYAAFINPKPAYDFADGADSLALSGHKFLAVPFPCGVVMARRTGRQAADHSIAYVATPDTTITGSRSGHAALFLWYALQTLGMNGLKLRYHASHALAGTALQKLQAAGVEAWRNPHALTVLVKAPSESVARKWQLATADGWSHIMCMPGVSAPNIDACIADLTLAGAT